MTGVQEFQLDREAVECDPTAFFVLSNDEVAAMSAREVVDLVWTARRLIARAQAVQARAIARLSRLRGGMRSVADELAPELGVSRHAAQTHVALAGALQTRLPQVLAAMDAGELDLAKAAKVFDATTPLSDEQAQQVDARIATRLTDKDPAAVRRIARRAVHAVDPEGATARARVRRQDRRVELTHHDDTMAALWMYLPAETASAAYARVDTLARSLRCRGETRTMDQLRADVVADLLLGKATGAGVAGQVFVHVPIDAALGISDTGCELAGHGPVPAEIAREIMADPRSVWRKITTDPDSGTVLDVGRTRYRPPTALAEVVRARDRECRAPGCHRPARNCEIDHNQPWAANGHTAVGNLCCLCSYHRVSRMRLRGSDVEARVA
ncbi:DUF222 domain-containing protein [Saccharomonospora sp. NPDC046836]|uniref:HNH endonuclease signature motif containing protein n=1 Tax=Saccharomonospora sp. NPDC046836 TaxID=3156921 RepID=UPI0033FC472C